MTVEQPIPPEQTLRVVVFDHRPLVAEGVASLLRELDTIEITAIATSRAQFADTLDDSRPDVVVVGIGDDCTEQTRALLDANPVSGLPYHVVGVIGRTDIDSISDILTTGVSSVVSSSASRAELQQAVVSAASGAAVLPPGEMAAIIIRLREDGPATQANLPSLSPREAEVLRALVNGWSTGRIAQTLGISTNTVRTHTQNLLGKLGVHSKLEATAMALRLGLVSRAGEGIATATSNVSSLPLNRSPHSAE